LCRIDSFYDTVTWPLTDTLSRKLDGCYVKLLRYALNYKWSDYVPNSILYNGLLVKQLSFAGHCSIQSISYLLLWDHTKLVNCKCAKGTFNANYSRQLLKAIGRVDVLVTSDEELRKLMLDREAWRSRVKMIVAANKEIDCSKREDNKAKREKTVSAI
jgi:hypothetical protein